MKNCPILGMQLAPAQAANILESANRITLQPVMSPCIQSACAFFQEDTGCIMIAAAQKILQTSNGKEAT